MVGEQDDQNYHNCNHQDEQNTGSYATADAAKQKLQPRRNLKKYHYGYYYYKWEPGFQ